MIHNPSTMAAGEKKDMEQAIAVLEEVKESILNAYAAKTGLSRNRLAKMMDAETWLNANEAMRLGFVDGILFAEDDPDKSRRKKNPTKSRRRTRTNPTMSRTNPTRKNPLHRRIPETDDAVVSGKAGAEQKSDRTVDAAQLRARLNLLKP